MPVSFEGVSQFSAEHLRKNQEYSQSLGLPSIEDYPGSGPLAIVGGGPSILQYKYTLQSLSKAYPGSIWAINRTWKWCNENQIDAVFFSFDPNPSLLDMVDGVDKVILGDKVDPEVYKKLEGKTIYRGEGNLGGTTSAGAALISGLKCGFEAITFFGCEGSYQFKQSHAYANFDVEDELIVWCDGMHFLTNPQMFMASIELSTMIKSAPDHLRERSGGLLRAMCSDTGEAEIVGCTTSFQDKVDNAKPTA